jgi:prophage regulatory protein
MRILRQRQVCETVGYSPMHLWRLEKAGKFPRRLKLGPNSVGWVSTEIDAWIEARIAERDAREQVRRAPAAEKQAAVGGDQ